MKVLATSLSGVPLLKVIGDVDHSTSPALDQSVQEALGPNGMRLFLDLADCPYFDSGGLSVLLCTLRQLSGKGWLGVIAPGPNVLRLFEILGLTVAPDFRVFAETADAKAALEG